MAAATRFTIRLSVSWSNSGGVGTTKPASTKTRVAPMPLDSATAGISRSVARREIRLPESVGLPSIRRSKSIVGAPTYLCPLVGYAMVAPC